MKTQGTAEAHSSAIKKEGERQKTRRTQAKAVFQTAFALYAHIVHIKFVLHTGLEVIVNMLLVYISCTENPAIRTPGNWS